MRTILIIQSLIILIGAYYIYTLSNIPTEQPETQVFVLPADDPKSSAENIDVNTNESLVTPSLNEESAATATLPTDMGMEYPVAQ